jgi:hypothetical protein
MKRFLLAAAACAAVMAGPAAQAQAPAAVPAAAQPAPAFVLYVSPASRALLTVDPDLKWRVNRWRELIVERGATFAVATHPAQLAAMPRGSAIVMPSAVVLGDEERRVIAARIAAGDGLLATGMPGTLDGRGLPILPAFLEQTFAVKTKIARLEDKGFLIPFGDTPLTYTVTAGARLWTAQDTRFTTPVLASPGSGYLSDWSRAVHDTGLLSFTTVGNSRRALLGWSEPAWEAHPAEFRRIAHAALDWVEGRPIAFARAWPAPYRAAMTLGVDALWRFENLPRIAEAFSKGGVRASFHFLSADVAANAAAIRDLAKAGHSVGGFGDSNALFAGQPAAEQEARVERVLGQFRNAFGADIPVAGLRVPQGATDAATEKAAAPVGYLVDLGRVDSSIPVLAPDGKLVVLSNNANVDAQSSAKEVAEGLSQAARQARLLHGYAYAGIDAAGFTADSPMERGLAQFLGAAGELGKTLWMAPAADVAAWWRQRERVKVSSTWSAADSILTLEIAVSGPMPFPSAVALVLPPGRGTVRLEDALAGARLQPEADGGPSIVLTGLPAGRHRLRLRFQP